MSIRNLVKQVFVKKENRCYAKRLRAKRISYADWLAECRGSCPEGGVYDFVVFIAAEGKCTEDAVCSVGNFFRENPEALLVYGDEDVRGEEVGFPWYKPDWSPDLFRSYFYFGSFVAVRRCLIDKMAEKGFEADAFAETIDADQMLVLPMDKGRVLSLYKVINLAEYAKWMDVCVEIAGGYRKNSRAVGHVSEILYSCRTKQEQKRFLALPGRGITRCNEGKISVIIPSKDNPVILAKCLDALLNESKTTEQSIEVVVVDNGSSAENREKVQALLEHISNVGKIQTNYCYHPMEFNFSKMCNLGAKAAGGDYLLFLNDDVELSMPETLEEMLSLATQEYTGAVGVKLLYPNSEKIQHAGITNLPMGPVHKLQFLEDNRCYYYGANCVNRNVLAVTAACMMVDKKKFAEAGGFAEELCVAFNDVDLCFSLYELGYHNVCVNEKYAYHHESLSRGADESAEKLDRLLAERQKLYERHGLLENVDPYYSQYLNHDGLDTRIRPGYITSHNKVQNIGGKLQVVDLNSYRQDECLLVRTEDFRNRRAVGYGVVLGDDNACYEKRLVLGQVCVQGADVGTTGEAASLASGAEQLDGATAYGLVLEGQYRPDLEENMPDQENVALSGYDVVIGEGVVPKGIYRIGMVARNRVTGLKLVNWTNRYAEL